MTEWTPQQTIPVGTIVRVWKPWAEWTRWQRLRYRLTHMGRSCDGREDVFERIANV